MTKRLSSPCYSTKKKSRELLAKPSRHLATANLKLPRQKKYAHVTYFFNGGETRPFAREDQVLIPSPKDVATYDLKPEMSAHEVTHRLLCALEEDYQFLCVNYANCDMVGHTGNYLAAVKAVETVDQCVGKLMEKCRENNITLILTADHGNCDQMVYEDGHPHTSHSDAPVPFVVCHPKLEGVRLQPTDTDLALKDVSPTILSCLDIAYPQSFAGQSIFP